MRAGVLSVLVAVTFAGCSGDDGPAGLTQEDALASGLGVIEGLLVDDRFRPVELTEGPGRTESQARGFILVQETGDQLRTTVNGEFRSPPLAPATYTLRVQIEGHETVPMTVTVRAGEVTEATVIARRTVGTADLVLTFDFSMFIPCSVGLVATNYQPPQCMADLSGDTNRYRFVQDLTTYTDARYLVTELLLNHEASSESGTYEIQIAAGGSGEGAGVSYATKFITQGTYDKTVIERGADPVHTDHGATLTHGPWDNTQPVAWALWNQGRFHEELAATGLPAQSGVGPQFGTKASVIASLLWTDDADAAAAYCAVCGS
jgi:hypothetical protein